MCYTEIRYDRWYIDVLATTVYSIVSDLYHDTNPIYRGYQYKHISFRALSISTIYQQVYEFIGKPDLLLVYRCISYHCIFYRVRPLS